MKTTSQLLASMIVSLVSVLFVACDKEEAAQAPEAETEETEDDRLIAPISRGQPDGSGDGPADGGEAPVLPSPDNATTCDGISLGAMTVTPCTTINVMPVEATDIPVSAAQLAEFTSSVRSTLASSLPMAAFSSTKSDWRVETRLSSAGADILIVVRIKDKQGMTLASASSTVADLETAGQVAIALASEVAGDVAQLKGCLTASIASKALDFDTHSEQPYEFDVRMHDLRGTAIDGSVVVDVAQTTIGAANVAKLGAGQYRVSYLMSKDDHNTVELSAAPINGYSFEDVEVALYAQCGLVLEIVGSKEWHDLQATWTDYTVQVSGSASVKALIPVITTDTAPASLGAGLLSENIASYAYQAFISDCDIRETAGSSTVTGDISAMALERDGEYLKVWIRGRTMISVTQEMNCPSTDIAMIGPAGTPSDITLTENIKLEEGFSLSTTGDDGLSHYSYTIAVKRLAK
jgi:hypothetical protein